MIEIEHIFACPSWCRLQHKLELEKRYDRPEENLNVHIVSYLTVNIRPVIYLDVRFFTRSCSTSKVIRSNWFEYCLRVYSCLRRKYKYPRKRILSRNKARYLEKSEVSNNA